MRGSAQKGSVRPSVTSRAHPVLVFAFYQPSRVIPFLSLPLTRAPTGSYLRNNRAWITSATLRPYCQLGPLPLDVFFVIIQYNTRDYSRGQKSAQMTIESSIFFSSLISTRDALSTSRNSSRRPIELASPPTLSFAELLESTGSH